MDIFVDTREKERAIVRILKEFDQKEINYDSTKLYVGDYMNLDNARLVIDRKQSLAELCQNVVQDHSRFVRGELQRARDFGIKMVILCEHGGTIKTLDDVQKWENPRLKSSPMAVSGERLYRILKTISKTYGVEFLFCKKQDTGKRIIEILGGDADAAVERICEDTPQAGSMGMVSG